MINIHTLDYIEHQQQAIGNGGNLQ